MSRFKIGHTFQFGEQVTPKKLNDSVNKAEFGADAVDDTSIEVNIGKKLEVKAQGVTNDKLAEASVSEDKVQGLAITTKKLADSSVTIDKLAAGSVSKDKVQDLAITTKKLADTSVSTSKIQSSAITTECIADGAITRDKLAENAMGIKSIQRGTNPSNSTSIDISIDSVNPSKCIVLLHGGAEDRAGVGEGDAVQYNPWVGSLTETNLNVRFHRVGRGGFFSWEIAEFY